MDIEMAPENAILMGNNSRFPNMVEPGEQANERRNEHYKGYKRKRGKEGIARAYARLDYDEIGWNNDMYAYYKNHPDKLEECQFSDSLIDDIEEIQIRQREIGDMTDIIREKGIFEFDIPMDKIEKHALKRAVQDSLELAPRKRSGGKSYFESVGNLISNYCAENAGNNGVFLSKEKDIPKIQHLIYDKLDASVIIKIAAGWGFHFI